MLAYRYNEQGEYIGEIECQLNPVASKREGKEIYLLPAFATLKKPNLQQNCVAIWNGEQWKNVEIKEAETKPVEKYIPTVEDKIAELKAELSTYDYIGIKIAMGVATVEDYADKIAYTQELRKQINELQNTLTE